MGELARMSGFCPVSALAFVLLAGAAAAAQQGAAPEQEQAAEQQPAREAGAAPDREQATAGETAGEVEFRMRSRDLARLQQVIRRSTLARDVAIRDYLERMDRGEISLETLAGMGNALARRGATEFALGYYRLAVQLEPSLPGLWVNVGTLYRDLGHHPQAVAAYRRALRLDPNHALAHYNLGAVYDAMGRYDEAIEEFLVALTLDPSLGDPAVNPQAVTNERLPVVQLLLYQRKAGVQGLPLIPVEELVPKEPGP